MRHLPFFLLISAVICSTFSCEENKNKKEVQKNRFATDSLYSTGNISFQLERGFHEIKKESDLEQINFSEGFDAPYLGTYIKRNIISWLGQNAHIFYKSLGKEKCDLIIFIDQKQPLVFNRELVPEFTKNFKASLIESYQVEPFFVEEDYADNYKNIYYKTKFSFKLEDKTPLVITNYIITDNKSYYGMLVSNFGGHSNDYKDIMATLEMK